MGKEEPEAEDRLGHNVKDCVANNFSVNIDVAGTISNTPNAITRSAILKQTGQSSLTLGILSIEPE